jgi:predicted dehydrogenase
MEETLTLPPDSTLGYGGREGVALVREWLDACRGGGPCRNTPESNTAVLELIDAIYRASREGRRIECTIGVSE